MATLFVKNHDLRRLDSVGVTPGKNPSNLEDEWGQYHRVWVVADAINYVRADVVRPGPGKTFDQQTKVTTPPTTTPPTVDSHPCIARDADGRLHLVFERSNPGPPAVHNVLLVTSDDDGKTWAEGVPLMPIPGGKKPRVRVGKDGTILTAAVVGDAIRVTRQETGDPQPSAPYTVLKSWSGQTAPGALQVEDDTFDFDQGHAGDAPWLLVCVKLGETSPTEFESWDDLHTTREVT